MVTLTCPNSSSSVKKRIFFAVEGAWRVMTSPATLTLLPLGIEGSLLLSRAPSSSSRSLQKWMRWWPVERSEMRYSSWLMSKSSSSGRLGATALSFSSDWGWIPRRSPLPCHRSCQPQSSSRDRKSTRLNSSHDQISYAVFCLKKKKNLSFVPYLAQKKKKTKQT